MQLPRIALESGSEVADFMPRSTARAGSCADARAKDVRTLKQCRGVHNFLSAPQKNHRAFERAPFVASSLQEIATKQCVARAASASTVRITHRYAPEAPFHAALARVLLAS
jgi:hypothetical protein